MTVTEIEKRTGLMLALVVLAGSVYLIAPFFQPMFWAALMVMTTWPLMARLNKAWHKPLLNAGVMSCLWAILVFAPLIAAIVMLSGDAKVVIAKVMAYIHAPLPDLPGFIVKLPGIGSFVTKAWADLPGFIVKLPGIGSFVTKAWADLQGMGAEWFEHFKPYVNKSLSVILAQGGSAGKLLMDISLTLLFAFLFYWEGERVVKFAHDVLDRLAGSKSREYVSIVTSTLQNVINGIVGTALAQAVLALIGFAVAGVPGALLLGVATFFLALIPMGPPLVWIPAAGWLFYQGELGWAIALAIWGVVIISGVDNVLKPLLISRGSVLPLPLVLLGVFGGVLNLGFIGIFIGPAVIALGYSLVTMWLQMSSGNAPEGIEDESQVADSPLAK